jgi:hypothetical protein
MPVVAALRVPNDSGTGLSPVVSVTVSRVPVLATELRSSKWRWNRRLVPNLMVCAPRWCETLSTIW